MIFSVLDLVHLGRYNFICHYTISNDLIYHVHRWVCTSGDNADLETTDRLALEVLKDLVKRGVPKEIEQQYADNIKWISEASKHKMVVGSKVRTLVTL